MKKNFLATILCFSIFIINCIPVLAASDDSDKYTWDNLKLGNYCWMTGMVIHPKDNNIIYVRTDVGGLYRYNPESSGNDGVPQAGWDTNAKQWVQLLDGYTAAGKHCYGVHSVAIDPNDTNVVYAAYGYQGQEEYFGITDIIKSTDKGQTWTRMQINEKTGHYGGDLIFCGNDSISRTSPESLIVDPKNSNVIYFGTQKDGLWRTLDGGASWEQIASVPTDDPTASGDSAWRIGMNSGGVAQVYIPGDNQSVSTQSVERSKEIYLSVWGHGVYKSTDGGDSFALMNGSPVVPYQIELVKGDTAAKDKLYVSSRKYTLRQSSENVNGGFWVYKNSTWTNLSNSFQYAGSGKNNPNSFGAFMIDKRNANKIYVMSAPWVNYTYLWKTTDGGSTWQYPVQIGQASVILQDPNNLDNVWCPAAQHIAYIKGVANYAQTTDWDPVQDYNYGTITTSSTGEPMPVNAGRYFYVDNGVEGLVCSKIVSMPTAEGLSDAPLVLVNMMDHGLRVQEEFNKLELKSKPYVTTGGGVDFCEQHPNYVFRTGTEGSIDGLEYGMAGYSLNYGRADANGKNFTEVNWNKDLRIIDCAVGAEYVSGNQYPVLMAVSLGHHGADDSGISKGTDKGLYRSQDGGATWQKITTVCAPSGIRTQDYCNKRYIASDRVDGDTFYYLGGDDVVYITRNAGNTWNPVKAGVNGAPASFASSGIKAVPGLAGGLWVMGSDGYIYATYDFGESWKKVSPARVEAFGFGVGNGQTNLPAAYVLGYVNNVRAIYISDNLGGTWSRISPNSQTFVAEITDIAGDRNEYGRVFASTAGRGVYYGDGAPDIEPNTLFYRAGETLSLVATVDNTTSFPKNFLMIAAFYSDSDELLKVDFKKATAPANSANQDITYEITVPDFGECTEMRAFVFDNWNNITPLFKALSAKELRY